MQWDERIEECLYSEQLSPFLIGAICYSFLPVFNRPGVAVAVLQIPLQVINLLMVFLRNL